MKIADAYNLTMDMTKKCKWLYDGAKRKRLAEICNQPPVSQNGELFIFLIDLHRNQQLRKQAGLDDGRLHTMDLYLQGLSDATLAVQNMYVAADWVG